MKGWESGKEKRARYNILILIRKIYEFTDYTHTHTHTHTQTQASLAAQTLKNMPAMQETQVRSLGW